MIWGPSGENSADQCYDYNQLGTLSGNCGYNPQFNEYLKCKHKLVFILINFISFNVLNV